MTRPRPEPSFDDVYDLLVAKAERAILISERVQARCGIGNRKKQCRGRLGSVWSSSEGPIWVPVVTAEGHRFPGACNFALPSDSFDDPAGFSATVSATCSKCSAAWWLGRSELRREFALSGKGASVRDYFVRREVPKHWGPMVNDPKYWTDRERAEATESLKLFFAGGWPPEGLGELARSKIEARMVAILEGVMREARSEAQRSATLGEDIP